jgi:hypothetical protein
MSAQTEITATAAQSRQNALQEAIDKQIAHIKRLRVGQAGRAKSKYKKRLASLQAAQLNLQTLGAWINNQAYNDAVTKANHVQWNADRHYTERKRLGLTHEEEIDWQIGFARTVVTQEQRDKAVAPRIRPVQEKPVKPERKYVSVAVADILALAATTMDGRYAEGAELLKKLVQKATA